MGSHMLITIREFMDSNQCKIIHENLRLNARKRATRLMSKLLFSMKILSADKNTVE